MKDFEKEIGNIYDCGKVQYDMGDASVPCYVDGRCSVVEVAQAPDYDSHDGEFYLRPYDIKTGEPIRFGRYRFYRNSFKSYKKIGRIGETHEIINGILTKKQMRVKMHKLQIPKTINWDNTAAGYIERHKLIANICETINELVVTVDKLQTRAENVQTDTESRPVNVQAPFAEQRKWIGKLCKFWDEDAFVTSNDWAFGILTSIDKGMQYQYCCNENCNFKHCEPVKPDDDIIYQG